MPIRVQRKPEVFPADGLPPAEKQLLRAIGKLAVAREHNYGPWPNFWITLFREDYLFLDTELKKRLEGVLTPEQVDTGLRTLTDAGLVRYKRDSLFKEDDFKVYRFTEAGRRALQSLAP